jgi:hypothetical protein
VAAGCPDSSVSRFAARPVGAANTIFARFAAAKVITDLTVDDLPQPGPPVNTATRWASASRTACSCSAASSAPVRARSHASALSQSTVPNAAIRAVGVLDRRSRAAATEVSARWNTRRRGHQQPESQRTIAAGLAGATSGFDMGGAAKAGPTGWFVPPFELVTGDGATRRVAEVLRDGRPVLLDLTGRTDLAAARPWAERVRRIAATASAAPTPALLVLPDGYVAWAGADPEALGAALTHWFGEPEREGGVDRLVLGSDVQNSLLGQTAAVRPPVIMMSPEGSVSCCAAGACAGRGCVGFRQGRARWPVAVLG